MSKVKWIFVLVVAAVVIAAFWQNRADVTVDLLVRTVTLPLAMLLTITLVVGYILGAISAFRRRK